MVTDHGSLEELFVLYIDGWCTSSLACGLGIIYTIRGILALRPSPGIPEGGYASRDCLVIRVNTTSYRMLIEVR